MNWGTLNAQTRPVAVDPFPWKHHLATVDLKWVEEAGGWKLWEPEPDDPVKAMTPDPSRPREIEVELPSRSRSRNPMLQWARDELERLRAPAASYPGPRGRR